MKYYVKMVTKYEQCQSANTNIIQHRRALSICSKDHTQSAVLMSTQHTWSSEKADFIGFSTVQHMFTPCDRPNQTIPYCTETSCHCYSVCSCKCGLCEHSSARV